MTLKVQIRRLHEKQKRFLTSRARFRLFVGGIGSGKTVAGAFAAIKESLELPTSLGMVIAPTYPMLRDATWRTFLKIAKPLIVQVNRSEMRVVLPGQREVLFRSADEPDRLRGPNLDWFWLDEAAQMSPEVWLIMIGRLRAGGRMGRAWVTTTPKGKNWVYEVFVERPRQLGSDEFEVIQVRSDENIYLPPDFLASVSLQYGAGAWARQELGGEFVDPEGAIFRREWFKIVESAPEGLRWVRYWDLAVSTKESADYTASIAAAMGQDGTIYFRDLVRGKWEWPDQEKIMVQTMLAEGPGVQHGIEKALHGIAAVQALLRKPELAGISLRGISVDKDKLTRALPLAARAEQGKVALVRGDWNIAFIDELCAFGADSATHDDQVDAASGALMMLTMRRGVRLEIL